MDSKEFIIQPNHVSTARYSLTAIEKNIIYTIVDELQKVMSKDLNQVYTEQKIVIEMKRIDKNNNYLRIKNAVKSLGSKHVEFQLIIPGTGKIEANSTSLVSGISHVKNSKHISFKVPSDACRFFCYIGGGFTSFQKTIAINLNSIYSKMLYELCCRWVDKGGFSCSIEKFKEYLGISNKYKQIVHLKSKVLDASVRELKEKADLYFTYSLKKEGRKYVYISIKIHKNIQVNEEFKGVRQEYYAKAYLFLLQYFPTYIDNTAQFYADSLINNGMIEKAVSRFNRLDDDFTSAKKTKEDIRNLLLHIILPEYGLLKKPKKHPAKAKC